MPKCSECQQPCDEGKTLCQNCEKKLTTEAKTPSSTFEWFNGWIAPGGSY